MSTKGLLIIAVGLLLLAPAFGALGQDIPPEVTQYAKDWPLPHKDYNSTRETTDSSITSGNVQDLGLAWSVDLTATKSPGGFGYISTNPIIMGNTVYFQDTAYNVWSVDFETGAVNWRKEYNTPWIGPNGVALGWGKLFAPLGWYNMGALDPDTGDEIWNVALSAEKGQTYLYINIQPVPFGGKVYAANAPHVTYDGSGGMAGYIYAFDQETGIVDWAFNTIASPNFWGHPEINSGGGAWMSPSIDVFTGMTYWGTANPGNGTGPNGPYSGTAQFPNGASRPGPNLYTNSIVALTADEGTLKWYNQAFPHDIVDHDFMLSPILTTARIAGQDIPIAIGSGKAGIVMAFDRTNGSKLWETPVGKHNGYDYVQVLPEQPTTLFPGLLGGVETPMAYSDGVVFAPYVDLGTNYSSTGESGFPSPLGEGTGGVAALDVYTGDILWDTKLDSEVFGGATVVNDLVFTATYDGVIYALNKSTGEQVWSYTAPGGINSWPAVAGDTIVWGSGFAGQLLALRLGATSSSGSSSSSSP